MSRKNCRLSVAGFGSTTVTAVRVTHGMSIVAYAGESQSRVGKAFYTSKRTSGSFELRVLSPDYRSHVGLADWLERYSRWVANPSGVGAPMRVTIPVRNFDSTGVLKGGVSFGDESHTFTYSMELSFMGARDPMALRSNELLSRFTRPTSKDPSLPFLYPGGTQLKGDAGGWDTIYDDGSYRSTPQTSGGGVGSGGQGYR